MEELILKYKLLDTFGQQELMDFLEFLVQKKQKKMSVDASTYKQQLLQVSTWSEDDLAELQAYPNKFNFKGSEW
ncbi:hypothetical protein [Runella sp. SP2]|uniref:hypothetical protein n=1 Tax=Runella sp. SP2 TaxID=2268026 RepID=UPI000F083E23|nr:hypothetical protein [Runella sp. SP2]AYQ32665.1 hypothetical protein DTQ70_11090 [Runella sp. SP2]